jgi:hypothetical protein
MHIHKIRCRKPGIDQDQHARDQLLSTRSALQADEYSIFPTSESSAQPDDEADPIRTATSKKVGIRMNKSLPLHESMLASSADQAFQPGNSRT